jgi:hypothetical protein
VSSSPSPDMPDKIRVGVVGASAVRGWALGAHRPVLAASSDFAVTAVAGSTAANAAAAAQVWGAEHSFADPVELINHPEVDLVVLAVVLPRRVGLIQAALDAGKHVYCEWPLAEGLADLARSWDSYTDIDVRVSFPIPPEANDRRAILTFHLHQTALDHSTIAYPESLRT